MSFSRVPALQGGDAGVDRLGGCYSAFVRGDQEQTLSIPLIEPNTLSRDGHVRTTVGKESAEIEDTTKIAKQQLQRDQGLPCSVVPRSPRGARASHLGICIVTNRPA